jgi:hypothetical protein
VTTSLANLSGGLGELTDGVIPTQNWFIVEAPAGNGPYVGWANINPTITFFFDKAYDFTSVTFHLDDSNGSGGVAPPSRATVAGQSFSITDPVSGAPFAYTAVLSPVVAANQLTVQLFEGQATWIFLSEVTFEARVPQGVVPVPAALPLLASGLGALALLRRRRKA